MLSTFFHEPDVWSSEAHGLELYAQRNYQKAWCGYVRIPRSHPLFDKGYDSKWTGDFTDTLCDKLSPITQFLVACQPDLTTRSLDALLNVHGSVTFAGKPFWKDNPLEWWLGFDCSHSKDLTPYRVFHNQAVGGTYRTLEYVQVELTNLAEQITNFKWSPA